MIISIAQLVLDLVRIPSVSGEEAEIASFVESYLKKVCPNAWVKSGHNRVVVALGFNPEEKIPPFTVLAGHLDTVPFNHHPDPEIVGEELIGLGSTDMKGGLGVMLALAEAHAKEHLKPIVLVFYDSEEVAYEKNGLRPLLGDHLWLGDAELAVLMEPTGNTVELGCLGTMHGVITFEGVAAHSARPWMGENAIHMAGEFLTKLAAYPIRDVAFGDIVYREVLNATMARGGVSKNVIPDRFEINLNFRFAPDRNGEQATGFLRDFLPENATLQISDIAPSASPSLESQAIQAFCALPGLEIRAKQAWTDVAQFTAMGVPALNFGPGIPELAHRRDESIPVANLDHSYETLLKFLRAS